MALVFSGAVLRRARTANQKSVDELANQAGLTGNLVRMYEIGFSIPNINDVSELARLVGVTVGELLVEEPAVSMQKCGQFSSSRFRRARNERNVTVEWLSIRTGLPLARLRAFEDGSAIPSFDEIMIVATVLRIPLHLFAVEVDMVLAKSPWTPETVGKTA